MQRVLRPRRTLSFNRRPRWHRFLLALMARQLGLLGHSIISMPSLAYEGDWYPEVGWIKHYGSMMTPELWQELSAQQDATFETLPWLIDINVDRSGHTSQYAFDNQARQPMLDSYVQIVTESYFEGEPGDVKISEKTCKAIGALQPFVVFGTSGTFATLESYGFVRPRHLDLAYDAELDVGRRLDGLYRSLQQIRDWSLDDMHLVYYDNLEITTYNRTRLFEMPRSLGLQVTERLRTHLS